MQCRSTTQTAETIMLIVAMILFRYTVLGKAFSYPGWRDFPVLDIDVNGIEAWLPKVTQYVANGSLKANPLLQLQGGLQNIDEGLNLIKSGNISAQKIVYTL